MPMGCFGIIIVFSLDGTHMPRFTASVSMDAEVVGIIKTSAVPCVINAVFPNLFGNG